MARRSAARSIDLTFENAQVVRDLFGVHDEHLRLLERQLGVHVAARGNTIRLTGSGEAVEKGEQVLVKMYSFLKEANHMDHEAIEQAVRVLTFNPTVDMQSVLADGIPVLSKRRMIAPRSPGQRVYIAALRRHDLVFGIGPAGTGKTYLAMAMAIASLIRHQHEHIILTRPAVEAGEKLGFLPGSMLQKVDPYLRPLYDALHDMMEIEQARRWIDDGLIEVAPLAFMRGRTLSNSFVILDEAQNCTPEQMKMFLTRLGVGSKAVITGDITQVDLPQAMHSGLVEAIGLLRGVAGIAIHYLTEVDVVRHPLVQSIIQAYDRRVARAHNGGGRHGR